MPSHSLLTCMSPASLPLEQVLDLKPLAGVHACIHQVCLLSMPLSPHHLLPLKHGLDLEPNLPLSLRHVLSLKHGLGLEPLAWVHACIHQVCLRAALWRGMIVLPPGCERQGHQDAAAPRDVSSLASDLLRA